MPQNNKYSSTYCKVKSHLGHIKIENRIFFLLKTSMPGSSYKRSTFSKYFEKWRSLEKLTPVDIFFFLEYKNIFSTRKYIFLYKYKNHFSKTGWIKNERSLSWIYCQLFRNHFLKIVNNKLFDFFKSHIHKNTLATFFLVLLFQLTMQVHLT